MSTPRHKARLIITDQGKHLNLADCKAALLDDQFVLECGAMLVVAKERGDPMIEGLRRCLGNAFMELADDGPDQTRN